MCPCQFLHIFPTYFTNFTNFGHLPDPPPDPARDPPGTLSDPPGTPQDPLGPPPRGWSTQLVQTHQQHSTKHKQSSWQRSGPAECAERLNKGPDPPNKNEGPDPKNNKPENLRQKEGGSSSWHRNTIFKKKRCWDGVAHQAPVRPTPIHPQTLSQSLLEADGAARRNARSG